MRYHLILITLLLGTWLVPPRGAAVAAQEPDSDSPWRVAQTLQSDLFAASTSLLAGDQVGAATAISAATATLDSLRPHFTADDTVRPDLDAALATAAAAVEAGDSERLAFAHGLLWATLVRGAYAETMAAVDAGDATAAATWLLLREYRPTTRFARPNADATLAVRALATGELDPAAVAAAVRADLLDTYQSRVESALNGLTGAEAASLTSSQSYDLGITVGYWELLAPAYEEQFGSSARQAAEAEVSALAAAASASDAGDFAGRLAAVSEVVQSFRAAPLSAADQARRSGQLLRYLDLVAVEYGRGVKQGEVLLDFEITEAQAFLDGARAAFADLRLPLREINAAETAAIDQLLGNVKRQLDAASARTEVTDPAVLSQSTDEATRRLTAIFPAAWLESSGDADFDVVTALLDQMLAAISLGEYQQANANRIEAYAIFETGPEKRLLAFAPSAVQRVEQLFWDGTGATPGLRVLIEQRADPATVRVTLNALEAELSEARQALSGGTAPQAIVFNAATIVFREGLEAVLILASLLASMVGANRRYKMPLAIGAVGALVATVLLFILARTALLSFGQYSEQIEAIVSVVAIGVLLLVMNWFFHKVYWTRWIAGHHERRRLILGGAAGQALGLVILGFTSVFREGAETVLFLQALVLDAGTWIVVQGTVLGVIATAVVGVLTLVLQTKLPHKKMLIVTGLMIALVLVTMVGGTVHTLQLVGWLPIHAISRLEQTPYWLGVWFGVFPTWEGLLAQMAALVFVVGSYYLAEHAHRRSRGAVSRQTGQAVAG